MVRNKFYPSRVTGGRGRVLGYTTQNCKWFITAEVREDEDRVFVSGHIFRLDHHSVYQLRAGFAAENFNVFFSARNLPAYVKQASGHLVRRLACGRYNNHASRR